MKDQLTTDTNSQITGIKTPSKLKFQPESLRRTPPQTDDDISTPIRRVQSVQRPSGTISDAPPRRANDDLPPRRPSAPPPENDADLPPRRPGSTAPIRLTGKTLESASPALEKSGAIDVEHGLSREELDELKSCEATIAKGEQTFVVVGQNLETIRDRRLYRETDKTFEAYCQRRWNFGRARATQLIGSSNVARLLTTVNTTAPTCERQVRPLIELSPVDQEKVWLEAVKSTPNGPPTGEHVREVAKRFKTALGQPTSSPKKLLTGSARWAKVLKLLEETRTGCPTYFKDELGQQLLEYVERNWPTTEVALPPTSPVPAVSSTLALPSPVTPPVKPVTKLGPQPELADDVVVARVIAAPVSPKKTPSPITSPSPVRAVRRSHHQGIGAGRHSQSRSWSGQWVGRHVANRQGQRGNFSHLVG